MVDDRHDPTQTLLMDTKFLFVGVAIGLASCLWGVRVYLYRARKPGEADVGDEPIAAPGQVFVKPTTT